MIFKIFTGPMYSKFNTSLDIQLTGETLHWYSHIDIYNLNENYLITSWNAQMYLLNLFYEKSAIMIFFKKKFLKKVEHELKPVCQKIILLIPTINRN